MQANRNEIARVLGVSLPTITDWIGRGMPVVERGGRGAPWVFDVPACVCWRIDWELAQQTSRSTKDLTLEEAERRQTIADATLKEIKVAEALREVVRVEEVSRLWEGRIIASREAFLGVAARLAPILVGESDQQRIEQAIEDEIGRALTELASWEPDDPSDLEDDDGDGSAED